MIDLVFGNKHFFKFRLVNNETTCWHKTQCVHSVIRWLLGFLHILHVIDKSSFEGFPKGKVVKNSCILGIRTQLFHSLKANVYSKKQAKFSLFCDIPFCIVLHGSQIIYIIQRIFVGHLLDVHVCCEYKYETQSCQLGAQSLIKEDRKLTTGMQIRQVAWLLKGRMP